jgi:hypothetical protein
MLRRRRSMSLPSPSRIGVAAPMPRAYRATTLQLRCALVFPPLRCGATHLPESEAVILLRAALCGAHGSSSHLRGLDSDSCSKGGEFFGRRPQSGVFRWRLQLCGLLRAARGLCGFAIGGRDFAAGSKHVALPRCADGGAFSWRSRFPSVHSIDLAGCDARRLKLAGIDGNRRGCDRRARRNKAGLIVLGARREQRFAGGDCQRSESDCRESGENSSFHISLLSLLTGSLITSIVLNVTTPRGEDSRRILFQIRPRRVMSSNFFE